MRGSSLNFNSFASGHESRTTTERSSHHDWVDVFRTNSFQSLLVECFSFASSSNSFSRVACAASHFNFAVLPRRIFIRFVSTPCNKTDGRCTEEHNENSTKAMNYPNINRTWGRLWAA